MTKEEKALIKEQKKIERQNKVHPLRYKKAGVLLTRAEVAKIKAGRKQLRADMKKAGIKDKKDKKILETASGSYFDERKAFKALGWIVKGRVLIAILLALLAVLTTMFLLSEVTKMKGHFSVNITEDLFEQGFSIGEELVDGHIKNPTSYLAGKHVEDTPCASITYIAENVDEIDGSHNGRNYFAHTFYIENTGETPADYDYEVRINSQSMGVSKAAWVMLFVDGKMTFYARANDDGSPQTLPARDDNTRGYRHPPFKDVAELPDYQYELIDQDVSQFDYYRLVALPFESDEIVTSGRETGMQVGDVHKYTVVLWLEGDDPDCTNDLIGGHLGLEFNFKLVER